MNPVFLPAVLGIGAITVFAQPAIVQASNLGTTQGIASRITVRLNGDHPGSGVIVGRAGTTHYVLTAKHVLDTANLTSIITGDGRHHPINPCCIERFNQVDLALVSFDSATLYPTATLAYPQTQLEPFIFIYGFPVPGVETAAENWRFRAGTLLNTQAAFIFSDHPFQDGYELFYNNIADPGMSGGPILDGDGRVIGIHGRSDGLRLYDADADQLRRVRIGISAGIPIQTFLQQVPQSLVPYLRLDDTAVSRLSVEEGANLARYILASPVGDVSQPDAISLVNYSNSLYRIGRPQAAIHQLDRAIQINPILPDAWYFLGIILSDLEDYEAAQIAFQKAIDLAPDHFMALRQQAIALRELERYPESLMALERALQLRPQSYVNWYLKGELLRTHLNQPQAAHHAYSMALDLNPDFPPALQGFILTNQALQL
jgi:hypothetical protein